MDPQDACKTIHPKVIAVLGGGLRITWRLSKAICSASIAKLAFR